MPIECPHGINLTNFNCEKCASEHANAYPEDSKPFPSEPTFRVHHDGQQWVCELDCYTGTGKTIGRAIDAAITVGLGFGRSKSLKEWVNSRFYLIQSFDAEAEEETGA